ncbi:FIST N-terminal domain-containing protein [Clostridium sp. BL-8]|uniref:FIST signal transduction protein n=1 Tax=Clostridium sp. BL-8 TaxID=349938 RepID=UPI00098CB01F|nr:FIST N-terminal domain-containing protein [Clostridium sp. BL-8]OOM81278.1 FIST N domain protein [Clostridium sp. BL-8]
MKYKIGKSVKNNFDEAISEATIGLNSPKLILFFSNVDQFEGYAEKIKEKFNSSIVIGSTTFAGFCKDGAYKNGLLLMGIEDGIECYGGVLEEVERYPLKYVDRITECVNKFHDTSNTVCFEISSALISCEELALSTLNSVLEDKKIPLFGGSAGDPGRAEKTMISFNGKVYSNACAFVIIKNLSGRIKLYRENIYKPTEHYFTATKVDVRNRIVHEYDNKPAAKVMAEALNTTINELPKYLDSYPLGRIIGSDMYITANQMVTENNGMAYHARVYNNSKMVLLEPDAYKNVIRQTINKVKKDVPNPSLSIMVNCLARSMLFEKDGYLNEFAKNMSGALGDYIGFAGYGEQLGEQHFNQTMVLAVFE